MNKRKKLSTYNPKREIVTLPDMPTVYSNYSYNEKTIETFATKSFEQCTFHIDPQNVTWINVDGLRKEEVEELCERFHIHPLLAEDILSIGQRAKSDDIDSHLFALMPMLYYNTNTGLIQIEQLSIVLSENLLISFQPDPTQDPFNPLRERLKNPKTPVRERGADYLAYCLMDAVVDDYYTVIEKLSERLERLEDEVIRKPNDSILLKVSLIRHELMTLKRAITPVRELINSFRHSENPLVLDANRKYFKDVYDHITLAIEYTENYREMATNLQDLYVNQVNTKMNEVMKILTVVTTILAPATVIGGVFGMNFVKIPFSDHPHGFVYTVLIMLSISVLMLLYFRKKGWF
ncbi:magnesium/cobalt transporter CorA [Taibaiella lutea]|uniref:Magnesium transport protein CorA n=2 Tax=Taibaiella lutea TaxID=2608001 RepID=A0A5M6CDX2_9BACT|nr:magnesium/cobalt transporter CorA [Taibaiella lutea]